MSLEFVIQILTFAPIILSLIIGICMILVYFTNNNKLLSIYEIIISAIFKMIIISFIVLLIMNIIWSVSAIL